MPSESQAIKDTKQPVNKSKSSIIHKPFATGTINFFKPHKGSGNKGSQLSKPKLFLNAELESELSTTGLATISEPQPESEIDEIEYRDKNWLDSLLSPWGISAIAILISANLISAGVIWRTSNQDIEVETEQSIIGQANLSSQEFMPLNLSTLSQIKSDSELSIDETAIKPISPNLVPLNNAIAQSLSSTTHHYILAEYLGDKSLSRARQKVDQVSLVNLPQGVFIYLGAFTDREQAQQFVSQLEKADLPTRIYPFN